MNIRDININLSAIASRLEYCNYNFRLVAHLVLFIYSLLHIYAIDTRTLVGLLKKKLYKPYNVVVRMDFYTHLTYRHV